MNLFKKILWRLTILPLVVIFTTPILLLFRILRIDKDCLDTKETLFYLGDIGWEGVYKRNERS